MSVTKIPMMKRLAIRWNCGLNAQMEPVFAMRSYRNVNFSATDAALFQLGTYINTLCVHVADQIRVEETHELEESV